MIGYFNVFVFRRTRLDYFFKAKEYSITSSSSLKSPSTLHSPTPLLLLYKLTNIDRLSAPDRRREKCKHTRGRKLSDDFPLGARFNYHFSRLKWIVRCDGNATYFSCLPTSWFLLALITNVSSSTQHILCNSSFYFILDLVYYYWDYFFLLKKIFQWFFYSLRFRKFIGINKNCNIEDKGKKKRKYTIMKILRSRFW